MEFLRSNFYDTTTMITVNSNTVTAEYLFDPDVSYQYVSTGFNNDSTTATITITFGSTQSVSRIALMSHNLKSFTVFYNGSTANTFALTSGSATTTSDFSTNSETSHFLRCNPVNCTSISIDMKSTIVANSEKSIGYLVLTNPHIVFDRPPPSKGYDLKVEPIDVVHKLSDGGTRIQIVSQKRTAKLSYSYLDRSTRDNLYSLFKQRTEFIFCPFGTSGAWDAVLFPCVWEGAFDFFKFSDNATESGHSGKINLMETPR